jgi:nucleoside-diphosphate-sugar epimerase
MKILVTGGAGCIGSDLAEALAARGDHVRVVDNLSSEKSEHIAALRDEPECGDVRRGDGVSSGGESRREVGPRRSRPQGSKIVYIGNDRG